MANWIRATEESSVVQIEGQRKVSRKVCFYNLDAIISVGYRVNSVLGVKFRQWATRVLKEYLLRGYSVNARMNQLEDKVERRLAKHDGEIAELWLFKGTKEQKTYKAEFVGVIDLFAGIGGLHPWRVCA